MKRLLTLTALLAMNLAAADISGNWKGTAELQNATIQRTFTFKQDGTKLTGETVSERTGKSEIKDGKVEGNTASFSVNMNFQGNDVKINYSCQIAGEDIKCKAEAAEGGFSVDYVLKRAQ